MENGARPINSTDSKRSKYKRILQTTLDQYI